MKGFSNREFQKLITELQSLVGCRFQELGESNQSFLLNFWRAEHGIKSWILDLNPRNPLLLPLDKERKARSPVKKAPITLFIKAHIEGRILNSVDWNPNKGRVFSMNFGEGYGLEFRLFTGGANWLAEVPDKKLSLKKPSELKELEWQFDDGSDRSLEEIYESYSSGSKGSKEKSGDASAKHEKKMQKAILKLKEDIESKKTKDWAGLGNWLLENNNLDVPEHWQKDIDQELSPMENSQRAFQKAKDLKAKLVRAEERLSELEKDLAEGPRAQSPRATVAPLKTSGKGRTKTLATGHSVFVGKNAADNLKILRAASSWDYWLHLKDYPGAHAILRRNKKEKLSQAQFHEAGRLLVQEHLKKKASELSGEVFDVLLTEVRFVRPIKGDKLGRVNYTNESVISCRFDS